MIVDEILFCQDTTVLNTIELVILQAKKGKKVKEMTFHITTLCISLIKLCYDMPNDTVLIELVWYSAAGNYDQLEKVSYQCKLH